MSETLIGRGKAARIYKIADSPDALTRKEFSPIYPVRLWNWFFYNSPHPLTTEAGHKCAFWKRRLAHRLCKWLDCNIHLPDALQLFRRGFTSRYIEGHLPTRSDKRIYQKITRKLEDFFDHIGMPSWSFSRKNPFSSSNLIIQGNTVYFIDYEQSVPVPDSKGNIGYDTVYFDDVHKFFTSSQQQILDKLGIEELRYLKEAFEMARECQAQLDIRPKNITKFINSGKRRRHKKKEA